MGSEHENRKRSSGRRTNQAPVSSYRGKSLEHQLTLAVFGQLALEPHFGDAFRSLFPSPTLEDYQHLFSAVIHKNPSMEADLQKVQFFTRSEPDSQRPSLEPLRKEIERHFKPEFFAEGHELSTFDFSQTAISFDGERGEELHRQSV